MSAKSEKKHQSIFSLPLAPVLYPTEEEFSDAWTYLRNVSSTLAENGICVIQPPKTWDKNCFLKYIQKENYTFPTKIQNVHQLFNYKKKQNVEANYDVGYTPGKIYTMKKFEEVAHDLEKQFSKLKNNLDKEKQYWKIIDGDGGSLQVFYGSDIDISEHGSGFPQNPNSAVKSHQERGDEFQHKCKKLKIPVRKNMTTSPWNLNNLAERTFLHHMDEDIRGVTCPMLYVGMLFSSFCWHTEDNYLYSINYNHHGADKIWYAVPSNFAHKFEETVRKYVPDLFKAHPNLLYLLATQISPKLLVEAGVKVFAACQSQGQFVVTSPQSYHAGFNAGFNCAESVNFALEDWLPFCRMACNDYRFLRRSTFSFEEFVIRASSNPDNVKIAQLLKTELTDIIKNEQKNQKKIHKEGVKQFILDTVNTYQGCQVCGYDCYISGIFCGHHRSISCLQHAAQLCDCEIKQKRLLVRKQLTYLKQIYDDLDNFISLKNTS